MVVFMSCQFIGINFCWNKLSRKYPWTIQDFQYKNFYKREHQKRCNSTEGVLEKTNYSSPLEGYFNIQIRNLHFHHQQSSSQPGGGSSCQSWKAGFSGQVQKSGNSVNFLFLYQIITILIMLNLVIWKHYNEFRRPENKCFVVTSMTKELKTLWKF